MKQLVEKVWSFYRDFSEVAGQFTLFGMFEREDSAGKWDLVVSADWLRRGKSKTGSTPLLNQFYRSLQQHLGPELIVALSLVATLDPDEAFIKDLDDYVRTCTGSGGVEKMQVFNSLLGVSPLVELRDCVLNGIGFRRVIIFAYHPTPELLATAPAAR